MKTTIKSESEKILRLFAAITFAQADDHETALGLVCEHNQKKHNGNKVLKKDLVLKTVSLNI